MRMDSLLLKLSDENRTAQEPIESNKDDSGFLVFSGVVYSGFKTYCCSSLLVCS